MKIKMKEEKAKQLSKEIIDFAHRNNLKVRKKTKTKSKGA